MSKTYKIATALFVGMSLIGATNLMAGEKEQCFGVAKAGKNDCATKTSSCAGTSTKDGQKDAFIAVPKGMCEKIVGGVLKS